MRAVAALILAGLVAGPTQGRADRLVVSLSANQVAIGPNYTGAQLVLFGVIERDSQTASRVGVTDVVVTVRGPRETLTVRQKEAFGPVWINRSQRRFVAAPAVLGVLSSRPLEDVASPTIRARLRLGVDAIVNAPEFSLDRARENDPFRAALIRLRTRDGLWTESARGVVFVTEAFFRAPLSLPGTAPTGNYDVEVLVLSEGALLTRGNASFEVVKTGFEEQITAVAQDRALLYGLGIAALSLAFGWIASVIFRRD